MKIITDVKESNDLLQHFANATAQICTFHISHKKLAIRLSQSTGFDVLYILVIGCEHIVGPFSWNNANISIVIKPGSAISEPMYKIRDEAIGFELISSGGFSLAQGSESEFGEPFNNFFKEEM